MTAIKKTVRTTVTENFSLELARVDVIALLRKCGYDGIPDNADIEIAVPGGGDWSNCNLSVDTSPLCVTWTQTKET